MRNAQRGAALIEVLVAMLIVAFGLLGFVGLQAKTAVTNLEGYQRTQAMVLINDMVQRINLNRAAAATYVGTDIGVADPGTCPTAPGKDRDICEWARLLRGASEKQDGNNVGAILGARGCITSLGANEYLIAVAWRGIQASGAPALACGLNQYGDERLRRGASVVLRIGSLS